MMNVPALFHEYLWVLLLPFARISAMLMALPIIGTKLLPVKIRLGLSIFLTWIVVSANPDPFMLPATTPLLIIVLSLVYQIMIGVMFGLVIHILFQAFVFAGQIIAMQMGLGFAALNDPQNGASVPTVGQFYMIMASLLYLSMNGHLFMMQALVESFTFAPIILNDFNGIALSDFAHLGAFMFSYGLTIALPVIIALLITNISFGIVTKSAPQINIFTIGFTFSMVMGIALILVTLSLVAPQVSSISEHLHATLLDLVK